MRIVHVSDVYLPRLGGIEMQVHDLAMHQLLAGHRAWVLTREPPDRPGAAEQWSGRPSEPEPAPGPDARGPDGRGPDGWDPGEPAAGPPVPVRRVAADRLNRPTVPVRRALGELFAAGSVDAVHVHSSVLSPFGWTVADLASRAGLPTAVTLHSLLPYPRPALAASARVIGWRRWPVAWSAVSETAARPLRDVLGPDAVRVLPNGIEPDAWRVDRPRAAGPELTLISVLRLVPRKRPLALLRILARIRALVPATVPIRAVLVGEGPQRPRIERQLRRSGLDTWVRLTGRLDRPAIRTLLGEADVYLAPADLESFGIAALEARCAGLPVVAKAAGGVGSFVRTGREGLLVDTDEEMAAATADLLMSPRLWTMREHNRRTRPAQTWPQVIDLSLDLYDAAATAAGRPGSLTRPSGRPQGQLIRAVDRRAG